MKALSGVVALVVLFFALFVALDGLYIVDETEQIIITQFGQPVGDAISDPGLKMKLPMLQRANRFEKRFLEWDGDPNQVPTRDKRFIWVDTTARWRINDPLLFFQRLRDELGAQSRLDDILDGETRNAIAKHDLIELVRSSNRQPSVAGDVLVDITSGRPALAAEVLAASQASTEDLGIEILDFRFKRINYQEEVRREVYTRMISERKRIAEEYRSEGQGEAARISGDKDRQLSVITSEAYKEATTIRGKSDAEAADVYAAAYNQDPKVYRFLKTMELYESALGGDTSLVLSTGGDFLRYLDSER